MSYATSVLLQDVTLQRLKWQIFGSCLPAFGLQMTREFFSHGPIARATPTALRGPLCHSHSARACVRRRLTSAADRQSIPSAINKCSVLPLFKCHWLQMRRSTGPDGGIVDFNFLYLSQVHSDMRGQDDEKETRRRKDWRRLVLQFDT